MAQVIECLPSKCKALSSNLNTTKKKKKRRRRNAHQELDTVTNMESHSFREHSSLGIVITIKPYCWGTESHA
jgi:hypothetical protein